MCLEIQVAGRVFVRRGTMAAYYVSNYLLDFQSILIMIEFRVILNLKEEALVKIWG